MNIVGGPRLPARSATLPRPFTPGNGVSSEMRSILSLLSLVGVLAFGSTARSQDLPTTNDHGITITPDHLTGAIQESQDFWGPVRKHLVSDACDVASADLRTAAVDFLKKVHDGLHNRLFERTEADALDLITYLGHRLRRFEVYRRLRSIIGDDAVMVVLMQNWEKEFRNIDVLPEAEKAAGVEALLTSMHDAMKKAGTADDKITAADALWKTQGAVFQQMAATGAGKMMIEFEAEAGKLDPAVIALLLDISNTADWVLIVREEGREIGREDFLKAWEQWQKHCDKQTADSKTTVNR
jgi:hypothetical protein